MSGDPPMHTCVNAWNSILPPPPCLACQPQVFSLPLPQRLADEDIDRIAKRVIELLKADK